MLSSDRRLKIVSGLLGVPGNLLGEGLEGLEFPLPPQAVEKLHPDGLPIQVPVEVQNKSLYRDPSVIVLDGGADPHVGHSGVRLLVKVDLRGVDSEGGDNHAVRDVQVDRGEADGAGPQVLAVGYAVGQGVRVAVELVGAGHLPLGDESAQVGGGDGDTVLLHLTDDLTAHAQLAAHLLEPPGVALAHVAEVEVVPSNHMDRVELLDQIFPDKILPVHPHHAVKRGDDDLLDAVIVPHQPDTVLHAAEKGDVLAGDGRAGVPVEGEGAGGSVQLLGRAGDRTEQGSMSVVNAVEIGRASCRERV